VASGNTVQLASERDEVLGEIRIEVHGAGVKASRC